MDGQLIAWLALAASVISNGLTVWNFMQSPSKRNAADIDSLGKDVIALGARIDKMEAIIPQLPNKDSIHQLALSVERLSGDMRAMATDVKAVRDISVMTRDMIKDAA